jgi:hypothetical protein
MTRAHFVEAPIPESTGNALPGSKALRDILLACGVLSSLAYIAANVLGAVRWEGFSSTSQSISELSALGAPSRPVALPLLIAYSVLALAFGCGVWTAASRNRALRITAALLIGLGVVDVVALFFPMHVRGAETTLTDQMHIAVTVVNSVIIMLAIGFGAASRGKAFCLYSIATLGTMLVFGALAARDGPRLAAQQPTPWLGVTERIDVGAYLLWMLVLAVVLLRDEREVGSTTARVA